MGSKQIINSSQPSLFGSAGQTAEPELDFSESLDNIYNDLASSQGRRLAGPHARFVFGEGNPNADLMFIGEGPGPDEEYTGRPFTGPAGQLLDRIIAAIGMKRADCYLTNVMKTRPPEDRPPKKEEIEAYKPFLFRQIAAVKPRVIVALGNLAAQTLLDTKESITQLRGQFYDFRGIKVMPTFNPAYLLRVPEKKREVWEDMKKVREELKGA